MTPTGLPEYEVLILAPFGRDAEVAAEILQRENIPSRPLKTLNALCDRIKSSAGALLIVEEALTPENAHDLKDALANQEKWSNLPIILMTSQKDRLFATEAILDLFGMSGSISLLERPFRIVTFLSSVRVALQARARQYQVRDLLEKQAKAVEQQSIAVKQRDDFLSIASHELKTPITSLKLQVQMRKRFLKRGDHSVFSPEKVTNLINFTETQIDRLSRLVDDMLDISRIVNGKLSLNCAPVELGALVEETLEGFSTQFQAARCLVHLKIESRVHGNWDRYRIEQVIANLFSNTIKYGAGCPVHVTIHTREQRAVLTIQDQGMGIAPENQDRIFCQFERAVSGNNISGLGLGLFISRQILDLHDGTIRVESALGKGSTFVIDLPAITEQIARATSQ